MSNSKTIYHFTDVATFLLFHPQDLIDYRDDPIAWYMDHFRYGPSSRDGKIMAFGTKSDGNFKFRLTVDKLSDREEEWAGSSWTFPIRICHGAIYLDNSDGLPGLEQQYNPSERPDLCFELPNGYYSVTVTGIEFFSETGYEDMLDEEKLPSYVISFSSTNQTIIDNFHPIPPIIPLHRDGDIELPSIPLQTNSYEPPLAKPEISQYPLIQSPHLNVCLGRAIKIPLTDEIAKVIPFQEENPDRLDFKAIRNNKILHVLSLDSKTKIGVLAKVSGSSRFKETMIHFNFIGILRIEKTRGISNKILKIINKDSPPTATVSAFQWKPGNTPEESLETYRERIIQSVKASTPAVFATSSLNYDIAKLSDLASHGHITNLLINMLNIPTEERLSLLVSTISTRIEKLDKYLATNEKNNG